MDARSPEEAEACYQAGAEYVIVPSLLGAERFCELLKKNKIFDKKWKEERGLIIKKQN